MNRRKNAKSIAFFCTVLILVLVMIYSGLQILESTVFSSGNIPEETQESKTIIRDGVEYFPRQDITVLMVLGIDQEGPVRDSGKYYNDGLCDVVMLMIFDETNEELRVLSLNRDTMVDVITLGPEGKKTGTAFGQLALAHTYGSGLEDSCENTRQTVSDFLQGITIDHYLSMNMDAIPLLNDAVGGVTVVVVDDFSAVDPGITIGEMTLYGDQAMLFIRSRRAVGDQLNISRMERQKEYARGFMVALQGKKDDSSFFLNTFEEVSPYIVTDCSAKVLSSMMEMYSGYELVEIVSPEGVSMKGERFKEFHVDQEKLDELVLRLFYAPKHK